MKKTRAAPAPKTSQEQAAASDVAAIVSGVHGDPFAVLGVQGIGGRLVARCFIPHAETVTAFTLAGKQAGELSRRDDAGFFEGRLSIRKRQPLRYRAGNAGGEWSVTDPYSFGPVLGPMDDYYIAEGSHLRLFDKLGSHLMSHEGAAGVHFAVWAPNARRVSIVGAFNDWDGRRHPMRHRLDTGIWEIFIPDIGEGQPYKYEIIGPRRRQAAAEGRSVRVPLGAAAGHRLDHRLAGASRLGRRGASRLLGQGRPAPRADVDLRGPCRVLAAPRRRHLPVAGTRWPTG